MARARLRRAQVQTMLAAIREMTVALTTRSWHNNGAQATEAIQVEERRQCAGQSVERRHVSTRRTRKTVMNPHSTLERERMKGGRQRRSCQEHTCGGKRNAEESLRVCILLRCVRARQRLMYLPVM